MRAGGFADPKATERSQIAGYGSSGPGCKNASSLSFSLQCGRSFDVLFELPPLLAFSETSLFLHHADVTLLVSFVGRTEPAALTQAGELLERLSVQPVQQVMLGVEPGEAGSPAGPRSTLRRNTARARLRGSALSGQGLGDDVLESAPAARPAKSPVKPPPR